MSNHASGFIQKMKHPLTFRLFLFSKLPAAYFAGVRIREIDEQRCVVSVPFKWLSQNPFRSTYFACLSMAAEMSTGALAMAYLYKSDPPISMLVTKVESEYFKKATGRSYFTCTDGSLFRQAISDCIISNEAKTVKARSVGKNTNGDIVAEFYITWSFKPKKSLITDL